MRRLYAFVVSEPTHKKTVKKKPGLIIYEIEAYVPNNKREWLVNLGPFQTSCYCRAELNWSN